jgi:hypothetical protein
VTVIEALAASRELAGRANPVERRTSALLVRQSLEDVLEEFWAEQAPPMCRVSARSQLIGLNGYQSVAVLARPLYAAWSGLSRACHHRSYDGAPAAGELAHWIADVERFRLAVQRTMP